jgi:glyoxylase-like metal-dependent hydrolase (beta-lactamase superfamily II)
MSKALRPFFKWAQHQIPEQKADIILGDEDFPLNDFGIQGRIVHTPGHTPGHISTVLDSGEAFIGCMAHNNLPFRLSPGLPIFAEDITQVKKSWEKIFASGAKTIYPGHGNPFPVDVMKGVLKVP